MRFCWRKYVQMATPKTSPEGSHHCSSTVSSEGNRCCRNKALCLRRQSYAFKVGEQIFCSQKNPSGNYWSNSFNTEIAQSDAREACSCDLGMEYAVSHMKMPPEKCLTYLTAQSLYVIHRGKILSNTESLRLPCKLPLIPLPWLQVDKTRVFGLENLYQEWH